jgi:DNA uptake protein ComE-like DNA-binding protein
MIESVQVTVEEESIMIRSRLFIAFALVLALFLGMGSSSLAQSTPKSAKPAATTEAKTALIDINTASKADLMTLTGIGDAYSQKIIDGRPYARKDQLVAKKIIPQATYDKIKDLIIAKQPAKK